MKHIIINGPNSSRTDRLISVEDSLEKNLIDMVYLKEQYYYTFLRDVFHQFYLVNSSLIFVSQNIQNLNIMSFVGPPIA